jgi:hypothetical protein
MLKIPYESLRIIIPMRHKELLLLSKVQIKAFNYVLYVDKHVNEMETYFHGTMFVARRIHTDRKPFSKKRKGFNLESEGKQNFRVKTARSIFISFMLILF